MGEGEESANSHEQGSGFTKCTRRPEDGSVKGPPKDGEEGSHNTLDGAERRGSGPGSLTSLRDYSTLKPHQNLLEFSPLVHKCSPKHRQMQSGCESIMRRRDKRKSKLFL